MADKLIYKSDCRHFLGHIPCKPHKKHNVHCNNCSFYEKKTGKILIIKLGAIGDVIRTFEPRVQVTDIICVVASDEQTINVSIEFTILNTTAPITLDLTLQRTR